MQSAPVCSERSCGAVPPARPDACIPCQFSDAISHINPFSIHLYANSYARCLRCPIRDEEEVDIAAHFQTAYTFIEEARSRQEAVLVHCHEGKSRFAKMELKRC